MVMPGQHPPERCVGAINRGIIYIHSMAANKTRCGKLLEITVKEIKGKCPVYKVGDRILIEDPNILLSETDALCTHALSTLLHYVLILEHDWCPVKLGLTTTDDPECAYMQCVDPGKPYTNGGTVIFKCTKIVSEE
jgi:uncharacterized repeat protein (TIGR04076 family)